ncbi:MAG: mandelate racemase/muconate lactonizing enzyme family protein [Chloroflexi bacterium]|nr:mandelate racemase/muconate lactonizing enzyme family protein [Chloroflexota bacterium]
MRITDIKTFPSVEGRRQFLVKVETDEGIYGWGEGGLSTRDLAIEGAVKHYREWLIGKDPMRMGALWQEMYRSQYFEGGRVLSSAISAIDIALHDIVGKALGVPVYQLLGGKHRDYVPCFATTSFGSGEQLLERVRLLLEHQWNVIRIVLSQPPTDDPDLFEPWESIPFTAKHVAAVREAVGPEPVLGVEYHHRLSVAEAASFCQRMPRGTIDFLEEPIRDECPEAYEALRSMVDVPFAIGEEFASKWQFLPYIERGITNYARVDVCNVGGLTEAKKVAGWAEAHYIDLMPHNPLGPVCTAATIHLAAAVPNFSWLEVRVSPTEGSTYNWEAYPVQPTLEGSRFPVPDTPGLGIEVNEELASSLSFKGWEFPHLHRRDGSHTNW